MDDFDSLIASGLSNAWSSAPASPFSFDDGSAVLLGGASSLPTLGLTSGGTSTDIGSTFASLGNTLVSSLGQLGQFAIGAESTNLARQIAQSTGTAVPATATGAASTMPAWLLVAAAVLIVGGFLVYSKKG
jgi:hypothetical protein